MARENRARRRTRKDRNKGKEEEEEPKKKRKKKEEKKKSPIHVSVLGPPANPNVFDGTAYPHMSNNSKQQSSPEKQPRIKHPDSYTRNTIDKQRVGNRKG